MLALGQAVMAYLARVPWLAKDVIWLVPDARCGLLAAVQVRCALKPTSSSLVQCPAHWESFARLPMAATLQCTSAGTMAHGCARTVVR